MYLLTYSTLLPFPIPAAHNKGGRPPIDEAAPPPYDPRDPRDQRPPVNGYGKCSFFFFFLNKNSVFRISSAPVLKKLVKYNKLLEMGYC